jgi:hypothetical protein
MMQQHWSGKTLWLLVAGALVCGTPGFAADTKDTTAPKGKVTFVEGTTKKQKTGDDDWADAQKNTAVGTGDKVKTFRLSKAELELAKLDIIRLAPLTTIEINKLYDESKEKVTQTDIKVSEGDVWAQINTVEDKATFNINSPIAGAAIRGTVLRIGVGADKSTELKVYKGEVAITNAPGKDSVKTKTIQPAEVKGPHEIAGPREVSLEEWVYIVKQMQKVRINPQGQVLYAQDFKDSDADEQTEWVKWNKKRDDANPKPPAPAAPPDKKPESRPDSASVTPPPGK